MNNETMKEVPFQLFSRTLGKREASRLKPPCRKHRSLQAFSDLIRSPLTYEPLYSVHV